jgi:lysophospholipase L1-like esterase
MRNRISFALMIPLWFSLYAAKTIPMAIASGTTDFKFDFGPGKVRPGYIRVLSTTAYTNERGYGFVGAPVVKGAPFFFAIDLPEGNYNVTVTLGDRTGGSTTTVKAEARRLMLEKVQTAPGRFATRTFTVNVRHHRLKSGEKVRLKADEQPHLDWDDQLTLEFSNIRPCVDALEIARADDAVTVYIAGDSTVCDQGKEPWCAWGQMLPRFFKPGVAIANYAESGESLKSFVGERRLEKILDTLKAGDYLFLQFGHNDQKERGEGVGAFTTYSADLKRYIAEARMRGGIPVLVTPMNRRTFDAAGAVTNSLGDYPEAVRRTAREEHVPLIDLNAMSKSFYEALGPERSKQAFVHYPAGTFPGQVQELKDNTHFNPYGAYELARCIVEGIKADRLGIARFLANDVPPFDPAHPDPVEETIREEGRGKREEKEEAGTREEGRGKRREKGRVNGVSHTSERRLPQGPALCALRIHPPREERAGPWGKREKERQMPKQPRIGLQ